MKIGGKTVTAPPKELLVLHREPENIVFWGQAIPDMEEFHTLCPLQDPPGKLTKDGWVPDSNDPGYLTVLENHGKQRLGYMVIHTLEPSEIEWDTVKVDNPKTWTNWEADFLKAKFTQIEIQRIIQLVLDANSLNEEKLARAREDFLRGRVQVQQPISSPSTAPESLPSGEPANASA